VDDLNLSHVEKKVVEDIIKDLNKTFVKQSPLTTTNGMVQNIGMTFDYSTKGKVKISMHEYVEIMLELQLDMNGL